LKVNYENGRIRIQDPDPLVRGMDPRIRIRIHTKMSWIRNTDCNNNFLGHRRKVLKTSNAFSKSYLCCATSTPQIKKKTNFFVIQVRLQLQEKLGCDLTERKKEVDSLVMEVSASHTVKDQFRPSGLIPSVADPDPRAVAFLTPGSGSGIEKNPNPG